MDVVVGGKAVVEAVGSGIGCVARAAGRQGCNQFAVENDGLFGVAVFHDGGFWVICVRKW